MSLRKKLIRLAYTNSDLREDLLPLLKQASVAGTILQQLGGKGKLIAMLGAHTFLDHGNGISFKIKATAKKGINYIKIILDPNDTYTLEMGSIRGLNYKPKYKTSGLYWDALKPTIESETGLRLALF